MSTMRASTHHVPSLPPLDVSASQSRPENSLRVVTGQCRPPLTRTVVLRIVMQATTLPSTERL